MIPAIELGVFLLLVAVAIGLVTRRLGVPYPIGLMLGGLGIGFLPGLPEICLQPELVFAVFLPPILYQAAIAMPLRRFVADLRPILLLAFGLVGATTAAVALALCWIVPGMPPAVAVLIGALVSPPDAVAATAVMQRLGLPRRVVTILEGESLVNDAAALVIYKFAVAAIVTGAFGWGEAAAEFLWIALAGTLLGAGAGAASVWVSRRVSDSFAAAMVSLALPFAVYLGAEAIHASSVLAVVTAGLVRNWFISEMASAETRLRAFTMWEVVVFLINSLVFVLIGLQLRPILDGLAGHAPGALALWALVAAAVTILVRPLWVFPVAYAMRAAIPGLARRDPADWRWLAVISWSGMRGVVSLAGALALPVLAAGGAPFPMRDLVVFLVFTTIFATLVLQGLALPLVIRLLGVSGERGLADLAAEEATARVKMAWAALAEIDTIAHAERLPRRVVEPVRGAFAGPLEDMVADDGAAATAEKRAEEAGRRRLRRAAVAAMRRRLLKLHREKAVGDETLRALERELDHEELLLADRAAP
jgi:CPA1 family monovalent cation:H+ antiporter